MRWLALLLLTPLLAFGQVKEPTCWPAMVGGASTYVFVGVSANGRWAWWGCPDGTRWHVLSTHAGLSNENLGARLDTIQRASDPLRALRDSWRRNVRLPSSDTRFDGVRADMRAHMACIAQGEGAIRCLFGVF